MNRKAWPGLMGMVVGLSWLLLNLRHVKEQGLVAIGMPLVIAALGLVYFVKARKE